MMTDTAFVSSSLWQNDCLLPRIGTSDNLFDLDGLDTLPSSGSISERDDETPVSLLLTDWANDGLSSVAGSECSEQSSENSLGILLPVDNDYTSLLSSVFEDQSVTGADISLLDVVDPPSVNVLASVAVEDEDLDCSDWTVTPIKPRKRSISQCLTTNTKWTSLSSEEQVDLVKHITDFITHRMGLREQLDIIRLISPQTDIAPTDTQYVIDLDCFDDDKLTKVCSYIVRYQRSQEASLGDLPGRGEECGSYRGQVSGSGHPRCRRGSQHSVTEASSSDDGSSECSTPTIKPHTKGGRRAVVRERRRRQRKEQRQQQKERRSGLFKAEQVLALSATEPGDQDEVDILT